MKNDFLTVLKALDIAPENPGTWSGGSSFSGDTSITSSSPIDGSPLARMEVTDDSSYEKVIHAAEQAFLIWREVPAPQRGAFVRALGDELRKHKEMLGKLVSMEMGKSLQEGWGEVQEMIDICDFAVGLSRQLYGRSMHSERSEHRMMEQYHPLGVVGIISAFNFPVAVWSWNTMIAWVCGNVCVWKPSEKATLSALACQKIVSRVLEKQHLPEGICNLITGDYKVGERLSHDHRIPLVSATGSVGMGRQVGQAVAARLGRSLLELGGNNAIIISEAANLELAVRAATFGAVGTAGQRCTSTRRLIVHDKIFDEVSSRLQKIYGQLKIGDPLDESNHMGPLIDQQAVDTYLNALKTIEASGGRALVSGGKLEGNAFASGCYVKPAIYEVDAGLDIVKEETFAPILYMIRYHSWEEAIAIHNEVPQGLSSGIITDNLKESERFLSAAGSDCGIANVNIGTSGAEIGGAFGGEKDTGGGRESGSDAWKFYMRRQTNTINFGSNLPLAQGIKFEI